MRRLLEWYRYVNILSIDIAVGAVGAAWFFSSILYVSVLPYGYISLGLSVWMIYTIDHLRDARSISGEASTYRHRFHQKHYNSLVWACIIVGMVNAIVLVFARPRVVEAGVVLGVLVLVYLFIQRYLKVLKEVFVAALYSAGVLLPSISVVEEKLSLWQLLVIAQFAIVVLMNLLIFSLYDLERDVKDGHTSFTRITGKHFTSGFIGGLMVLQILCFVPHLVFDYHLERASLVLLMSLLLLMVLFLKSRWNINDRFRLIGDAIFFLPFIYQLLWAIR